MSTCCTNAMHERATAAPAGATGECACPALDVVETSEAYRVTVEVPGAAREDVELDLEKDVLTIRARVHASGVSPERYHVREHLPMELRRELRLGKSIQTESIVADVSRGVLTIHLPKVAAVTPRRIEVR